MGTDTKTAEHAVITTSPAGVVNVRAATAREVARRESAARTAARTAEHDADIGRGWKTLTADNVRDILAAGESIGREYLGSDAAEIATAGLDRVARWVGRLVRESETADSAAVTRTAAILARLATSRGASGYAARVARRASRQYASRHGTGRGSMPRLVLSDDEIDDRLAAVYGARSHSCAAATARNTTRELDHLELGERVAVDLWHAELSTTPTTHRATSDSELGQLRLVSRYERTVAAPMYSQWLDAYGDSVPTAGSGHTFAHIAPGVPTRDAAQLRRGSTREKLAAVGVDPVTIRAVILAANYVSTRGKSGRYPRRIPWSLIAAEVHTEVVPATLARRVTAALELVAIAESLGVDVFAADLTAASRSTHWHAVVTGREVHRGHGTYDAMPVVTRNVPAGRRRHWELDTAGEWVTPLDDGAGILPRISVPRLDRDYALVTNGAGDHWDRWTSYLHRRTHGADYQYGGGMAVAAWTMYRDR